MSTMQINISVKVGISAVLLNTAGYAAWYEIPALRTSGYITGEDNKPVYYKSEKEAQCAAIDFVREAYGT